VFAVTAWPIQPYYSPVLGIPIALYAVAVHRSRKISLVTVLASFIPNGVTAAVSFRVYSSEQVLVAFIDNMIALTLVMVFAWGTGRLTREVQFLESEREMAREAESLATERRRIARELHDIVSHAVTVMVVQAGGAARIAETDPRQVTQSLVHIETAGRQAMVELQRLLGVLNASDPPNHGTASGERGPQPGLVDLGALLDSLRDVGLLVTVHTEGTPRELDPSVDLTAYRIAQEALTNILRHAGIHTNPRLRLTWQAQSLHIQVDNDTNPTKTHHERDLPGGHGLLGLHERTRAVGGHLHAGPHQDGYRLTATLPLTATAQPTLLDHSPGYLRPPSPFP
jgi:signal transduction histidine kinase